uniref:CHK kinase-like domain-containing protein n=1 Tax=Musca domestica TaxID=7370 RepID=A0A1I8MAB2_MUSDO
MTGDANTSIPKWINANLFESVLKKTIKGYRCIRKFEVYPGSGTGENYATVMLKVQIEAELDDGSAQSTSFMLKTNHENEEIRKILNADNMFALEKSVYEQIVPAFEKLYADAGIIIKFGPTCYDLPTEESHILLENLTPKGFKNINRLEGLNKQHMEMVLRRLAMWHAASAVYAQENGDYDDKYRYGFFREEAKAMIESMHNSLHSLLMSCLHKYSNSEIYADELDAFQPKYLEDLYRTIEIDPNEFNVLNHGDCWSNNIMFQYNNEGNIQETYLIDYQLPKYGSPALDLYYFILSSAHYDVKLSEFDYFIKLYHDILYENLKLLKYRKKLPTLRDIHAILIRHGVWGVFTAKGIMAAVLVDPIKDANFEYFFGDGEKAVAFKMAMYSNDRYRKHMEAVMPWLKYRGAFDLS